MSPAAPFAGTGFDVVTSPDGPARGTGPCTAGEDGQRLLLCLDGAEVAAIDLASLTLEPAADTATAAVAVLSRTAATSVLVPDGLPIELEPGDTVVAAAASGVDAGMLRGALGLSLAALSSSTPEEVVDSVRGADGGLSVLAARYHPWDDGPGSGFSAWFRAGEARPSGVREAFVLFCASRDVPEAAIHDLALAVEEVLDNVVEHAYRNRPRGVVLVEAFTGPGPEVVVAVRDRGPAFDPLGAGAPDTTSSLADRRVGGLGIHLVRALVDDVRYARHDGENRLVLVKRLAET